MRLRFAALLALALLAPVASLAAQEPAAQPRPAVVPMTARDSLIEAQTKELAAELRCPVCQGLSLQDSPSELSQEMRDVIRDQLRSGRTPEQVKQYFISKYGEWILLRPEAHGINLAVYLVPVLLLVGGAIGILVAARRWTGRAPTGEAALEEDAEEETLDVG